MENDYNQKLAKYTFLIAPKATSIFREVDFNLKIGTHIQRRHPDQFELFNFIKDNYSSLKDYYNDFFFLSLESVGENNERFFYIDFNEQDRRGVPIREFLKPEFTIIGFFLCTLHYSRFRFLEKATVAELVEAIHLEYAEYKDHFYKYFARVSSSKEIVNTDEKKVSDTIVRTLEEFHKLGWVYLQVDVFQIMPALERLRIMYADYINNIDELIKLIKTNGE